MNGIDYKEYLISEGWTYVRYDKPYAVFSKGDWHVGVCWGCSRLIKAKSPVDLRTLKVIKSHWNRTINQLKGFINEGVPAK